MRRLYSLALVPLIGLLAFPAADAVAVAKWSGHRPLGEAVITGTVKSEAGAAISGATLFIEGTRTGTLSKDDGRYRLIVESAAVPRDSSTLVVRLIGYNEQKRRVFLRPGHTDTVNFTLKAAPVRLGQVVVTGSGTSSTSERLNAAVDASAVGGYSGSVAPMSTPAMKSAYYNGPVDNELKEADEVIVMAKPEAAQRSVGSPGSSGYIRIRGIKSLSDSTQPLFVVDGKVLGNSKGDAKNKFANTDPADIEKVEILKGSAATKAYGKEASNGVVLITLKKGAKLGTSTPNTTVATTPPRPPRPPQVLPPVTQGTLRARTPDGEIAGEFPLKHTEVNAEISGYLARTVVTQQYTNPFKDVIEAVYVFPLPSMAAVNDFMMEVGGRKIVGIVRPRAEAERIDREAMARGQTASLLTQERPNTFTQSVANIRAGRLRGHQDHVLRAAELRARRVRVGAADGRGPALHPGQQQGERAARGEHQPAAEPGWRWLESEHERRAGREQDHATGAQARPAERPRHWRHDHPRRRSPDHEAGRAGASRGDHAPRVRAARHPPRGGRLDPEPGFHPALERGGR